MARRLKKNKNFKRLYAQLRKLNARNSIDMSCHGRIKGRKRKPQIYF